MNFAKWIYSDKKIDHVQRRINMLGNSKIDAYTFLNRRLITTICFALIIIIFTDLGYIFIPFLTVIFYYLFYYLYITKPIKDRIVRLDSQAVYFFEVLTLTLESGRNLENSIELTCANIDSEISEEFKKALFEVKIGKSLIEALEDLKKRIPSETINNIILNIMQTSVFGNSIVDTMNNQVEFLRDKQVLEIKARINKIPNKVSIVSVLFIIPLILLLVLGPVLVKFLS